MLLSRDVIATSLLLVSFYAAGCNPPAAPSSSDKETKKAAPSGKRLLDPKAFREKRQALAGTLLDVRTPDEVASGRIAGASTINYLGRDFKSKAALMNKEQPLFVYCRSGGRSRGAVKTLRSMGFKQVYDLEGGIGAWEKSGLPVERSELPARDALAEITPEVFDGLLKEHAVVLVDFQTQWCEPCRKMAPIVKELQTSFKDRAHVAIIDVDSSQALATREKAEGVPVFVLYRDGKETWRHSGALEKKVLEEKLGGGD